MTESVLLEVSPGVFRFRDTCNVYVLRSGPEAVLVDFGTGSVLDHLAEVGIDRVTDVVLTHHHRDQLQGLRRAVDAGIRIWAPPFERDLIDDVDHRWETRRFENDYVLRQDRFSLLEQVPVAGVVDEYVARAYGGIELYALPTPGHTVGSLTYLLGDLAFSGDLVYGDGKVWSLAATQWSYSGVEGLAATVASCAVLAGHEPRLLLPGHGEVVEDPQGALGLVRARVQELLNMRREHPWDVEDMVQRPWAPITPHLLRNRNSFASSYALLSEDGAALIIDFGYDVTTGLVPDTERGARRPILYPFDALARDHGVQRVEIVVPTHFHDDHVAGLELLRRVKGTEVWAPENVAPILEDPRAYDLPCLWFDPIAVDRRLPLGETFRWHEYELSVHPLPGHTRYAAAIAFDVDGKRVVATGDQQGLTGGKGSAPYLNYQYRNRLDLEDFVESAQLYRALGAELLISGHELPQEVDGAYLDELLAQGKRLAELHRELLPLDEVDFGTEGFGARIRPYRSSLRVGEMLDVEVKVRNPFAREETALVELVVPPGWEASPAQVEAPLQAHGTATLRFAVRPAGAAVRARIGADLTVGGVPFGQQAEALVDVG
jgi:glyoxylase-like metal-dependent hydrolase (beta-lactamase superfamily II)